MSTSTTKSPAYIDLCFRQICKQTGVQEVIVMNENGNPAKSTMNPQQSIEICGMITSLIDRCAYIMNGIYENETLEILRLHTKHNEMIVTMDDGLVFIVVQCVSD